MEMTRVLKFQSGLPTRFWGDCVKIAVYLINKLPKKVLKGKPPYEVLFGIQPKIDHLKMFGCLCYASTLPRRDKLSPRARRTVLVGYSETQKGYRSLTLTPRIFLVSIYVSFRENVFPFKHLTYYTGDVLTLLTDEVVDFEGHRSQQVLEPLQDQAAQEVEVGGHIGQDEEQITAEDKENVLVAPEDGENVPIADNPPDALVQDEPIVKASSHYHS